MKLLLLLIVFVFGCRRSEEEIILQKQHEKEAKNLGLICVRLTATGRSDDIQRCENSEVICYTSQQYKGSGISCRFKGKE